MDEGETISIPVPIEWARSITKEHNLSRSRLMRKVQRAASAALEAHDATWWSDEVPGK